MFKFISTGLLKALNLATFGPQPPTDVGPSSTSRDNASSESSRDNASSGISRDNTSSGSSRDNASRGSSRDNASCGSSSDNASSGSSSGTVSEWTRHNLTGSTEAGVGLRCDLVQLIGNLVHTCRNNQMQVWCTGQACSQATIYYS